MNSKNRPNISDCGLLTRYYQYNTGSFNFTKSAQIRNAENILIIQSEALAKNYLDNFNKRKAVSKTYSQYCMSSTRCKISSTASDIGQSIKSGADKSWDATKNTWNKVTS